MSIDELFDRTYHRQKYNCANFVCEAWKEIKGTDISELIEPLSCGHPYKPSSKDNRLFLECLRKPENPCLALFQANKKQTHIAIFINRKILHITENGVEWNYLENVLLLFNKVRFYNVKSNNC